jgi:hypothetical protein
VRALNTLYKWLFPVLGIALLVFIAPRILGQAVSLAGNLVVLSAVFVNLGIPVLFAGVLLWFVYWLFLRRWLRLRKLQRVRVAQGRRHPLA